MQVYSAIRRMGVRCVMGLTWAVKRLTVLTAWPQHTSGNRLCMMLENQNSKRLSYHSNISTNKRTSIAKLARKPKAPTLHRIIGILDADMGLETRSTLNVNCGKSQKAHTRTLAKSADWNHSGTVTIAAYTVFMFRIRVEVHAPRQRALQTPC